MHNCRRGIEEEGLATSQVLEHRAGLAITFRVRYLAQYVGGCSDNKVILRDRSASMRERNP